MKIAKSLQGGRLNAEGGERPDGLRSICGNDKDEIGFPKDLTWRVLKQRDTPRDSCTVYCSS